MPSLLQSISSISIDGNLHRLVGRVTERQSHRSIEVGHDTEEVVDDYEDDGPLSQDYKSVFNVTLGLNQDADDVSSIKIFFYDRWADVCQTLRLGDTITVSGSRSLFLENPLFGSDSSEHSYCIAIREDKQPCDFSSETHFEVHHFSNANVDYHHVNTSAHFISKFSSILTDSTSIACYS